MKDLAARRAAPIPGLPDFMESINHVLVHEIGTWIVAGRALGPPRHVARVCVPGPWRKAMSPFLVAADRLAGEAAR